MMTHTPLVWTEDNELKNPDATASQHFSAMVVIEGQCFWLRSIEEQDGRCVVVYATDERVKRDLQR